MPRRAGSAREGAYRRPKPSPHRNVPFTTSRSAPPASTQPLRDDDAALHLARRLHDVNVLKAEALVGCDEVRRRFGGIEREIVLAVLSRRIFEQPAETRAQAAILQLGENGELRAPGPGRA